MQRKIDVSDLLIGMYISELDKSWASERIDFQGFQITGEEQIHIIQDQCQSVFIDPVRSVVAIDPSVFIDDDTIESQCKHFEKSLKSYPVCSIEEEFSHAKDLYCQANALAKSTRSIIDMRLSIPYPSIHNLIVDMAVSIKRCPDALFWLTANAKINDYCISHPVNVAILMMLFGMQLRVKDEDIIHLGIAGFLQDLGKHQLPLSLINKNGPLSQSEKETVRTHVTSTLDLLKYYDIPKTVKVIISEHHERYNGSGYPNGLRTHEISNLGYIAGIVDSYDAMISDRPYSKANTSYEALRELSQQAGIEFKEQMIDQFKTCIGIYHSGLCIELNSGEVGIILQQNPESKLRPRIMLLLDAQKRPYSQGKVLDLNSRPKTRDGTIYTIHQVIKPQDYGIKISEQGMPFV